MEIAACSSVSKSKKTGQLALQTQRKKKKSGSAGSQSTFALLCLLPQLGLKKLAETGSATTFRVTSRHTAGKQSGTARLGCARCASLDFRKAIVKGKGVWAVKAIWKVEEAPHSLAIYRINKVRNRR